jgi:hypothetical protein
MRHRTRVHARRSARRPSGVQVGFLVLATLLVAGALALMISSGADETDASHSVWSQALNWGRQNRRAEPRRPSEPVIYPYSVVPGGIHSVAELRQAMKTDPVVAAAYAKFNLPKFRIIKLRHDEYAYVSYRIGSDVYWTTRRLRICAGETLVTDGERLARTRCGNQLSQVPRVKTWSSEPPPAVLDTPAHSSPPRAEAFAAAAPDFATFLPDAVPSTPVNLAPTFAGDMTSFVVAPIGGPSSSVVSPAISGSAYGGFTPVRPRSTPSPLKPVKTPPASVGGAPPSAPAPVIVPSPPIVPPPGAGSTGGYSPPSTPNPPPPPSAVPEESSWVMFASGLAGLVFYQLLLRRRDSRTGR